MTPTIAVENASLTLGGRAILEGVSFSAAPGETIALLGPSGSGKSTLLRLVLGFVAPSAGEVRIAGATVSRPGQVLVPPGERQLAVVFQDLALWPHLTVKQHLDFGLAAARVPREERQRRINDTLERVGLRGTERRAPGTLSGGERQRVAIARALVLRPRAVLLDEPLTGLDVPLRRELLATFRSLFEEQGVTALLVTHDLREAHRLGARVMVLESGRITQTGTPAAVAAAPATPFVRALVEDATEMG